MGSSRITWGALAMVTISLGFIAGTAFTVWRLEVVDMRQQCRAVGYPMLAHYNATTVYCVSHNGDTKHMPRKGGTDDD